MRPVYRVRQFWFALNAVPGADELDLARSVLTPSLMNLFTQMQPSEQAHSLRVLRQLLAQGETPQDLQVAALLHDIGKICYPLRLWERVLIVVVQTLFRASARVWSRSEPVGWKRALVVAEQHPAWGAELARRQGATSLACRLIARHQDALPSTIVTLEDALLERLQLFDNES